MPDSRVGPQELRYGRTVAIVAYLTHPLGDPEEKGGETRMNNVANAMQWFKFMVMTTRWVITCPWFVYYAAIDDVFHRPRAIRDCIEIMSRSDIVVLCGGVMAPHMRLEMGHAQRKTDGPIPVLDLLELGRQPPWERMQKVQQDILRLARDLGL